MRHLTLNEYLARHYSHISFEELMGVTQRELEYTFYAKLHDLADLEKAPYKEEHEQWKLPLREGQPCKARLRMTDNRRYTLTTKLTKPGVLGVLEHPTELTKEGYEMLRIAALDGYRKTRYNFPIAGSSLKWEIDAFFDLTGQHHPWVKIDLEVKSPNDEIPPFPIALDELIVQNGPKQTSEQIQFVENLWANEWVRIPTV